MGIVDEAINAIIKKENVLLGERNFSYVFIYDSEKYIVRLKNDNVRVFISEFLDEYNVLKLLENHEGINVQRVIERFYYDNKLAIITNYIKGETLVEKYDFIKKIPDDVILQIARQIKKLHNINKLELTPKIKFKSCKEFYEFKRENYLKVTGEFFAKYSGNIELQRLKEFFYAALENKADKLENEPLVLCHADLNRGNLIEGDKVYLIDWDNALIGDSRFDIAAHFIKCNYNKNQIMLFLTEYFEQIPSDFQIKQLEIWLLILEEKFCVYELMKYFSRIENGLWKDSDKEIYANRYYNRLKRLSDYLAISLPIKNENMIKLFN